MAAVMSGQIDITEGKTVCVVSGGNVDVTTLSRVITKGLANSGRIVEISTKVVDKPGSLIQLLQVISSTGANVVRIHHTREDRNSDVGNCIVTMVLETIDQAHIHRIERELQANGYHLTKR